MCKLSSWTVPYLSRYHTRLYVLGLRTYCGIWVTTLMRHGTCTLCVARQKLGHQPIVIHLATNPLGVVGL
jgi:hypothetical protein